MVGRETWRLGAGDSEHIRVGRAVEAAVIVLLDADKEIIVFVEVKTRQTGGMSNPAYALATAKRRSLGKARRPKLAHGAPAVLTLSVC
ncbi:MAG: YraN family protein [Desulfovibrio sp.]|nr:YraN family protein [Desulfovibrio sp.]